MTTLRELMTGELPVMAPLVLNPLMAKLAEQAGFKALYLGGGATGYLKCVTEANLNLSEMCQVALDIKTVSSLPLILDGACGWGDPMHMHRTIGMSEAAGFAAIEIEDQILPKRAHHHVGLEHIIPAELMAEKIREAVAARRSRDFLIIARTNAARGEGLDEALRRAAMFEKAGADLLLVLAKTPDQVGLIGERVAAPKVLLAAGDAVRSTGLSMRDLSRLGYKLVIDASTPLMAAHKVWRECFAAMARGEPVGLLGAGGAKVEEAELHKTIGLEHMLAIEKRTVER